MVLTGKQKHYLRGLAHNRKPVVTVGTSGVTQSVVGELERALEYHELLKIKLPAADRGERQLLLEQVCRQTGAELVQLLGRTGTVYRPAEKPKLRLP